jgi:Na+-transporting methylmalonyl-CoA/oxaloacetate decarboxylase gamma subunit
MRFIIGVMLVIIFFPILFQIGVLTLVGIGFALYYLAIPVLILMVIGVIGRFWQISDEIKARKSTEEVTASKPALLSSEQIAKEWDETLQRTRKAQQPRHYVPHM